MSAPSALGAGATLGVIGGGQLGRYFVLAARQMGYDTWVLDPGADAPAMQVASHPIVAAYDDSEALQKLGTACDAVTIEFESVPASSLEQLQGLTRLAPAAASVALSQDRNDEKQAAQKQGLHPVPNAAIRSESDIAHVAGVTGFPAILKTARLGYDGKGQVTVTSVKELTDAWAALGGLDCVLEKRIDLAAEVSVVLVRGFDGQTVTYPLAGNVHVNGILHTSTVPSGQSADIEATAREQAIALANGIEHVGVLAVEFFVDGAGKLWFNEMAPRPHNSGHYSLDAVPCSQFEQQVRALCALPFGSTELRQPVSMLNLLGDLWSSAVGLDTPSIVSNADSRLHLYGKHEARSGRKMGHVNILSSSAASALEQAEQLFAQLERAAR